ncbi:MAG: tryptophan synthase subunit alpha [Acidimicrobiales bacterium]
MDAGVPLVAMTYYNLVFHMGDARFAGEMVDAGFSGMILPDVPSEEQGLWRAAADPAGIDTVLLAGPITPDDRLRGLRAEPGLRVRREPHGDHRRALVGGEASAVLSGASRPSPTSRCSWASACPRPSRRWR